MNITSSELNDFMESLVEYYDLKPFSTKVKEIWWRDLNRYPLKAIEEAWDVYKGSTRYKHSCPNSSQLKEAIPLDLKSTQQNYCCICRAANADHIVRSSSTESHAYCEAHYITHVAMNDMANRYGLEHCRKHGVDKWASTGRPDMNKRKTNHLSQYLDTKFSEND